MSFPIPGMYIFLFAQYDIKLLATNPPTSDGFDSNNRACRAAYRAYRPKRFLSNADLSP